MLKKLLFAILIIANFSAYSQPFTNSIGAAGLPPNEGLILDVVDYNNDGYEDVVYQNTLSGNIELYRNIKGVFSNVTGSALLPVIPGNGDGTEGVISFDYNNDGFQELLIMRSGAPGYMRLFKNNCGNTFTEITVVANLPLSPNIASQYLTLDPMVVVFDYDKDNFNDIIFCRNNGSENVISVLNNNGISFSGTGDLITGFGTVMPNIAVIDYDNDLDEDLLVISNSSVNNACQINLYDNGGTGNYTVQPSSGFTNSSPVGFANILDFNSDGYLDVLLGTKSVVAPGPGNLGLKVFRNNNGGSTFTDVSASFNTIAAGNSGDYFNSHIFDIENDGDYDVLWEVNAATANSVPSLMRNNGSNVFTDVKGALLAGAITSSGKASKYFIFDYNNDGALDIFNPGTVGNANAQLFKNNNNSNKYIDIRLASCNNNAEATGTRIFVKAGTTRQFQFYNTQGITSTTTGKSERVHFGLGSNSTIDSLVVYWPSGNIDIQTNVSTNQRLNLMDGFCNIGQPLVLDLGPDTSTVCNSDTAYLLAPSGFVDYHWSTGDNTADTKVTLEAWYSCTGTNVDGCIASDSIYIKFAKGKIAQPDTLVCIGTSVNLSALPRYDCSPSGAPVKKVVKAGDNLGPTVTYLASLNGHHYYKFNTASTWSKAESDAVKLGGHLAVINNKAENNFIAALPGLLNNNIWIGLYKADGATSTYHWVNCDTFEYSNWATGIGAPSSGTKDNFVYMRKNGCQDSAKWKNNDETVVLPAACETNFFGLIEFDPSTNISYLWSNGDTTVNTTIVATAASSHNVQITQNGSTCFGNVFVDVINANDLLPYGDTLAVCRTNFVMLQATIGMKSYLWSTGGKNSFIFVSSSGANRWYTVTAVTQQDCIGKDSVYVLMYNSSIKTPDTTVCLGTTINLRGPSPSYAYINNYSQDFQNKPFTDWNSTSPFDGVLFNGTKVLGIFANDSLSFNMVNLPTHDSVRVKFDLYIHDTWEGNCSVVGPDKFRFKEGTNDLINTTFSNTGSCTQGYTGSGAPGTYPAKTGATQAGLPRRCSVTGETTLYTITKTFSHSAVDLGLSWVGDLIDTTDNSSKCDESWTIDNVSIEIRQPGNLLWSTGDITQDIFVTPIDPTTDYWVQVPIANTFCYDTVTVTTYSGQTSDNLISADTIRSCGGTKTLITLPNTYNNYVWSNGDTNRITTAYNEGWYTGYVNITTSMASCYGSDSVYFITGGMKIMPNNDTLVCYGAPLTIKADLRNDCSPFGAPANTGFVPYDTIPGYTYKGEYRGHYYYLADTRSSWSVAAQNALLNGGHLACINDTVEQNFIAAVVDNNAWLGLYNTPGANFVWMNCDTLTFTNWAAGEPFDTTMGENYVFMMGTACPEAKKWDSHSDEDTSTIDPCRDNIFGLMEITPYQYTFDWKIDGVSTYTTDSFTVYPLFDQQISGLVSKYPGVFACGIGTTNVSVINEYFDIIPDSITKISCAGDTVMIEAKAGFSNYLWDNGDTTTVAVYSSTIGWAYCTYNNGTCTFKDSVYLNVPGKLVTTPVVTDITCYGANDGIGNTGITGGTQPYDLQWLHNGSTNPIETNLSPGVYYFSVSDPNGCSALDSVIITNPDSALSIGFFEISPISCNSDTNAIILAVPTGGSVPYTGTWVGYPYPDTLFNVGSGIYTYTVTDSRGCTVSRDDTLRNPEILDITSTIIKQIFCPTDTDGVVLLSATGGTEPYNYTWNYLPNPNDTVYSVLEGNFPAIVIDAHSCRDTVDVVMIASNPEKCGLVVPNGFTPNGDGINDFFIIKGISDYGDNELTIFNRWGETVYHANNYNNDWDGKPDRSTLLQGNDGIVPNDTYFYILHTAINNKTASGYVYITK